MIDKISTLVLNLVKTNVSIVLIFYASGFLSFIAYYRVLGIPHIDGNLQVYAEMAGKNLLVILQTFIFLITQPNYFIENINALSWVDNACYIWLGAIFLLGLISIIFKLFSHHETITNIQRNVYTLRIILLLVAITVLTTLHIETQSFKAQHVLQPNNFIENYEQKRNLLNFEKQTEQINFKKREKIAAQLNSDTKESTKHFFFSIPNVIDLSGNDKKRLNALMLMIVIVVITAIILAMYRQYPFVNGMILFFVFAQAILIPFNYGILGTTYQYPVVALDYTEKDEVLHKKAVFLLAKSQDNLVIYDRLNFFQISYIRQDSVIHLEQFFISSPFSNCTNEGFKPCESYAMN